MDGGGGGRGSGGGVGGTGLGMINTIEACERIKEEYNFLQAQNQSLKLECEKIAQEKTEMQRHYVMVFDLAIQPANPVDLIRQSFLYLFSQII